MKKIAWLVLLSFVIGLFAMPAMAADWTEFGLNSERTRYSAEKLGPPVTFNWKHDAGASMSQPIVVGDKIIHLGGSKLWVFEGTANDQAKEFDSFDNGGGASHSDPTWANNGVYFGTGKGKDGIYRLAYYNPSNKKVRIVALSDEIVTAPLVLDGDVTVVATADGVIHVVKGLSKRGGTKVGFRMGTGRITSSAGRLSGDSFVIGFDRDRAVIAYQVSISSTGEPVLRDLWAFHTEAGVPASISVSGDRLFFSDTKSNFYCLDRNGKLIWKNTDFKGGFTNDSLAVSPTSVFASIRNYNGHGKLVRLDKETGRAIWGADLKAKGANSPVIWGNKVGVVVVGDTNGTFYAFNGANGDPYPAFCKNENSPAEPTYPMNGAGVGNDYNRFSGAGTQITLASGNMDEGVLLAGANTSLSNGTLYCFKVPQPVDLAVTDGKLENEEGTKVSFNASYPLGKDSQNTEIWWDTLPWDTDLNKLKQKTPEQLKQVLTQRIDLANLTPEEIRNLGLDIEPNTQGKVIIVINPDRVHPKGEVDWDNNYLEIGLPRQNINLIAEAIETSLGGREAEPDQRYSVKAYVRYDGDNPIDNVPVALFNDKWQATLRDDHGDTVNYISHMEPGEKVVLYTECSAPPQGMRELKLVVDHDPIEDKFLETNEDDNIKTLVVTVKEPEREPVYRDSGLKLTAVSQDKAVKRANGTAKWTDWVTAKVTVDRPVPPKGKLVWWKVNNIRVTYPKKNPNFTFGCPLAPKGTASKAGRGTGELSSDTRRTPISVTFQEDWAMDGAQIYNMEYDELMAAYPKRYNITLSYTLTYKYKYLVCDKESCWWEYRTVSNDKRLNGSLLVNGTGVNSLAE